jgi:hypothetical protein
VTKQIKDIRVIEHANEAKFQWRLQVDYGSGWVNVKVRSADSLEKFEELQKGKE